MPPKRPHLAQMALEARGLCGGWVGPGTRKSAAGDPGPTQLSGGRNGETPPPTAALPRRRRTGSRADLTLLLLAGALLLEVARARDQGP